MVHGVCGAILMTAIFIQIIIELLEGGSGAFLWICYCIFIYGNIKCHKNMLRLGYQNVVDRIFFDYLFE